MSYSRDTGLGIFFGAAVLTLIIGGLSTCTYVNTKLKIYEATQQVKISEQSGLAKLKEAESSKQILVQQAQAEKDAAQLRADAIRIMGQAAKEYPEYRTQEFIGAFGDALRDGKINQIIYVPTEGNIPILEARKH